MSCDDLWLNICQKRDECDEKIKNMKGVAFFFSSVAALERRSKEKGEKACSQEQEDDQNVELPEKYWPAITYWIAVQSSNGMRVSTVPLHSTLLETGMEVIAKALPVCKRGNEEESCAPLCTTLKDHNNHFMQSKVDMSFSHSLQLLQDQLVEEPLESLHASERVVRLQVVCSLFSAKLRDKLIPSLVSSGLQFDVFGIEVCDLPSEIPKGLASPIVIAMNDIERAMAKLGYALHSGEMFKKVKNSEYTYQHCCSVKKFLSLLGSNDQFKDTIIKHLNKLVEILGDRECEFVKQLRVNYDLIEVNGGWCFSISQRKFVLHPIKSTEIGKESPRAYIDYEHTKTPDPGYFKQILQNSLDKQEMAHFCEYYIRLLNCGNKQHKERVMCLVGEPNSGKTSLFTPITRLIPARYIAMISKQKAFNKSLVDENTQIIFLDEAYAKLMDPDDWKILTQGGLTAHDRKYKTSSLAVIRCPMFITCQTDMDFGPEHNGAMAVRLRKFFFKRLTSPRVVGVQEFLQAHAMDCIVWACSLAITPDDELPPPMPGTSVQQGDIGEEEKERIRNMQLDENESDDSDSGEAMVGEVSRETPTRIREGGEESEGTNDDGGCSSYAEGLQKNYEEIARLSELQPRNSLKRRQLELIGAGVKQFREDCDRRANLAREQFLQETKARWIALGLMKEEDSDLLQSVDGPYHPNIERTREQYFAKKKAEEERQIAEKARVYYQDEWVLGKEKELQDLQKQEDASTDPETKRALQYMIEVAVDALKSRFQREEVPGLKQLVLLERRRKAVQLKWCSDEEAKLIRSIWCPLPFPSDVLRDDGSENSEPFEPSGRRASASQSRGQPDNDDEDDLDLFITPVASWEISHTSFERTRRVHEGPQRGKKRPHQADKVQHGSIGKRKVTNTILNYFSSQS